MREQENQYRKNKWVSKIVHEIFGSNGLEGPLTFKDFAYLTNTPVIEPLIKGGQRLLRKIVR